MAERIDRPGSWGTSNLKVTSGKEHGACQVPPSATKGHIVGKKGDIRGWGGTSLLRRGWL